MGYKERGVKQSRKSGAAKEISKLIEAAEVIDVILRSEEHTSELQSRL